MSDEVVWVFDVVVGLLVVEAYEEIVNVVRDVCDDFVRAGFGGAFACGEEDVLGFEFEDLCVFAEDVTVYVLCVSKCFESVDAGSDFFGLEVGDGELCHVKPCCAVFVYVDVVFCSEYSFEEVFWQVFAVACSSDAFDEFGVVFDIEFFEDCIEVVFDGYGAVLASLVFVVDVAGWCVLESAVCAFPLALCFRVAYLASSEYGLCVALFAVVEGEVCGDFAFFECALKAAQSASFFSDREECVGCAGEFALFAFFRSSHAGADERACFVFKGDGADGVYLFDHCFAGWFFVGEYAVDDACPFVDGDEGVVDVLVGDS